MAPGAPDRTGPADVAFAACPACRRTVTLGDDFVRLRDALYHLSCMLNALRNLGQEMAGSSPQAAALRDGIDAVRNGAV